MKKFYYSLLLLLAFVINTAAQAPNKISYQAVIRNSSDMILANQNVGIQISILKGSPNGTAVYTETQTPTTNANGLLSIEIGSGTVIVGDFSIIDWVNDLYFIKTEVDLTGGTNYTIIGTSQLLSVPYALHSKTAESVSGGIATYGDIKSGIQTTDHNGWVLLDGRALSSLSSAQQVRASNLGLSNNLPDARNKYLSFAPSQGSVFGNNTYNLTKENLPTDSFSGSTNYVYDNNTTINPGQYGIIRLSIAGEANTVSNADVPGASIEPDVTSSPIDHNHDFTLQLNTTQNAIDNRPETLNVGMFIYLGN